MECYPKCLISIHLTILHSSSSPSGSEINNTSGNSNSGGNNHGGDLSTCIMASSLALCDAGIMLRYLVSSACQSHLVLQSSSSSSSSHNEKEEEEEEEEEYDEDGDDEKSSRDWIVGEVNFDQIDHPILFTSTSSSSSSSDSNSNSEDPNTSNQRAWVVKGSLCLALIFVVEDHQEDLEESNVGTRRNKNDTMEIVSWIQEGRITKQVTNHLIQTIMRGCRERLELMKLSLKQHHVDSTT